MYQFIIKGGIFMYPIILCSILALAIFLERLWNMRRNRVVPDDLLDNIKSLVRDRKISNAIDLCKQNNSHFAKILFCAIENNKKDRGEIKERVEEVGRFETKRLERYVEALGTIAGVSTLLGLLGTISGMIKIFSVISQQNIVNPSSLAGGISEALYTTAAGLTVAIPSLIAYKYLTSKADNLVMEMEEGSLEVVEMFGEN